MLARIWRTSVVEGQKQRKAVLGVIFLTVFIDLIGFGIIIPLSPYLARRFEATPLQVGMLMAVYSLMQFIFSPVWGRISDRMGRRPILLMSLLGSTLSYLGFAFATTLAGLFLARIFAGIFGASISTAMAYIADVTPQKERSKGMGLIGAAFGMGFIFGPFIGGIAGGYGQRWGEGPPFGMSFSALVAAGICFLNFLLALRILKESLPAEKRGQAKARDSRLVLLTKYLRQPVVGPLIGVVFLSIFAMALMESTLFLYVQDKFGWGVELASYGFAFVGVMIAFTQGYLIRKLMPKWGERKTLMVGLVLSSLGMTGIALSSSIPFLALANVLLALGVGMTNPSVIGSISLKADETEQGMVMGVSQSVSALGRIVGPVMGGWVYGGLRIESPYLIAGSLMAFCVLIVLAVYAQIPQIGKVGAHG